MEATCETCRWYDPRYTNGPDGHTGDGGCRRMPPQVVSVIDSVLRTAEGSMTVADVLSRRMVKNYIDPYAEWPTVTHEDWCGEHQPRDTEGA